MEELNIILHIKELLMLKKIEKNLVQKEDMNKVLLKEIKEEKEFHIQAQDLKEGNIKKIPLQKIRRKIYHLLIKNLKKKLKKAIRKEKGHIIKN